MQVSPEAKNRSLEAKSRGDDAFRKKDYLMAVDAYTQVIILMYWTFNDVGLQFQVFDSHII